MLCHTVPSGAGWGGTLRREAGGNLEEEEEEEEGEAEREFAHVPFSVKYAVNCQYANEVRSLTHYCFKETKI